MADKRKLQGTGAAHRLRHAPPELPSGCLLLGRCSLPPPSPRPGEIDRCLKKVSEGVEQFEDIWQKVQGLGL